MSTPASVLETFIMQTEEEKIACHRTSDEGPYFEFEGYKLTLEEVAQAQKSK